MDAELATQGSVGLGIGGEVLGDTQIDSGIQVPMNIDQNPPFSEQKSRSKTSLRMRYEAETQVIKRKLGSLEQIRQQLGISQRKICQLLLVDPSAWSRWVRGDDDAPPHIYRMLQWYLALEEKYPALDVNFWLSVAPRAQEPLKSDVLRAQLDPLSGRVEALTEKIAVLQANAEKQRRLVAKLAIVSGVSALLAASFLFLLLLRN